MDLGREYFEGPIWLSSELVLAGELRGNRPRSHLLISLNDDRWTFAALAVVLNQIGNQWSLADWRLYHDAQGIPCYRFQFRRSDEIRPAGFMVKLHPHATKGHFRISVGGDTKWLLSCEWMRSEIVQTTRQARYGRELLHEKEKLFVKFRYDLPEFEKLHPISRSILMRESLLAVNLMSIGRSLKQFSSSCMRIPVPQTCETRFLSELCEALRPRYTWKCLSTMHEISIHLKGYLCLTVMPHQRGDPFPVSLDRESRALMSVVKGCYVSPSTEILFLHNARLIDGLLMDATWKIIRNCVASILMLSIMNVGIPVALAIGPKEDKSLYEIFYSTMLNRFGIDLGAYPVVSD
jgi:hypothetical protein